MTTSNRTLGSLIAILLVFVLAAVTYQFRHDEAGEAPVVSVGTASSDVDIAEQLPEAPPGAAADSRRSVASPEPPVPDRVEQDAAPEVPVDEGPSGRTPEEHLAALERAHQHFVEVCLEGEGESRDQKERAAMGLVSKSVAAILRSQGRAEYEPDPTRGGFVLGPLPDRWRFMSGTAKFEFPKGEFLAYDLIANRRESRHRGEEGGPAFDEAELLEYEKVFEAAASALESQL